MITIYALFDPRILDKGMMAIRYVGKTSSTMKKRLSQHLAQPKLRRETHQNHWLKQLLREGLATVEKYVAKSFVRL